MPAWSGRPTETAVSFIKLCQLLPSVRNEQRFEMEHADYNKHSRLRQLETISFVTLIRRWADQFCLHCNIFIYIRHTWIKPVLCSRMASLFHLEHIHAYSPHLVHIEMEEFSDVRFKQRAVIEFLNAGKFLQLKFTDECKPFIVIGVLM